MSIEELHGLFLRSTGICTDSRKIWEGCIYLALKGDRFDGNTFARQALDQGATYAIVDVEFAEPNSGLIKVENGLRTLQQLAAYHRLYCGWPTLAITGSNGKTTTKELIGGVLSTKFNILITEGNLNNHIGVPLTILRGTDEHELAIIEMGASHPGDIKELCEIADPDLGLITNIGKAHLEGMGGIEGVLKTKGELFDHITNKNGKLLLNANQPLLVDNYGGSETLSFGSRSNNDIEGIATGNSGNLELQWRVKGDSDWIGTKTQLVGNYNLDNVLAAITVGLQFGISKEAITLAITAYSPTNNRSEYVESGTNRIIWDAYNANPSSMESALANIRSMQADPVVLILGEMKEVGVDAQTEHDELVTNALSLKPAKLYLVGKSFSKHIQDEIHQFESVSELITALRRNPISESLILIKGSRSNQLEKLKEVL